MIPIGGFAYRFIMRRWNSKLERNVAQQIARGTLHGTSKEGGSRNDKSKTSCPVCPPSFCLFLFARRMQIALSLMANERGILSARRSSPWVQFSRVPRGYRLERANSCVLASAKAVRAHRCTKLRTNKSLWHGRRAQTQLCNATPLGNSIYVTVVLLSTRVTPRFGPRRGRFHDYWAISVTVCRLTC